MAACVLSMEGSQHWCKHSEEIGYLQFGYGWSKLSVVDSLINELKLKLVSKHKRSILLPKKNHSWICKFIIRINMETRHEWEEKTGQAVFKGTVLSMQSGAHASCSGGCGAEERTDGHQPATGNTASGGRHQSSGVKPRSALPCIYIIHNHNRPRGIHITTGMEWKDHPASWHICHSLLTLFISIIKCIQHASIKNFCNSRNQILWLPQANPLSCSATITIHQVHFRIFNAQ